MIEATSCGGVVIFRGKILLLYKNYKNKYEGWVLPKGTVEPGEEYKETALREVREESGLTRLRAVSPDIFSLEILTVDGHEKRGKYVSSHLHLNVTFLVEADPSEAVRCKPDENSRVGWFSLQDAPAVSSEPWMRERVYCKLNAKLDGFLHKMI